MQPYYERSGIRLYHGDAADALPTLDAESISAVVSDPPAGIAFMSKAWDRDKGGRDQWVAWLASILSECNRAMKPGAHAVIWAMPRTSGWTHRAIEDAGLDVRDCVTHLFGSGFPKSHNLPGGLGTALKPAAEFWYLARKPLSGTVAANVLAHGTGALNIDASRVGYQTVNGGNLADNPHLRTHINGGNGGHIIAHEEERRVGHSHTAGRWPANVLLDEVAAAQLDQMSGELGKSERPNPKRRGTTNNVYGTHRDTPFITHRDSHNGASRFFPVLPIDDPDTLRFRYQSKASRAERNAGLDGLPERDSRRHGDTGPSNNAKPNGQTAIREGNHHPTVKPLALMSWLLTLVTPPGGTVLDPFAGSGTTGVAAAQLGVPCVLIEQEEEYLPIIAGRIDHALDARAGAELPLFAGVAD